MNICESWLISFHGLGKYCPSNRCVFVLVFCLRLHFQPKRTFQRDASCLRQRVRQRLWTEYDDHVRNSGVPVLISFCVEAFSSEMEM